MKYEIEFLNYLYQNAKMGIIGIDSIIDNIKDKNLKKIIKEQQKDYYSICEQSLKYLSNLNTEPKDLSSITKIMTYLDYKLNTIDDKSNNNIAKIMINSSNKGIIEIQEKLNSYDEADKKIVSLARDLLNIEKRNINKLKQFL